jgi:FtsP/CotA-like multicopper oxidase with cupredoxin domain
LLDGGPSRIYEFFLSNGQPFVQISNDGNLLPRPLTRRSARVAVAERPDVIVDFSGAKVGDVIYLQNRLEQTSGRGPTGKIIAPTNILQFRVVGPDIVADPSRIPDRLLDLPARRPTSQSREWIVDRSGGAWTINDKLFDPDVISAFIRRDSAEIWNLKSSGGWAHPFHVHFEEFQVLSRDGKPPPPDEVARKDIVNIGQAAVGQDGTGRASLFLQFRDFLGDYPVHCHNVVHEDRAVMVRFQVVE